MTRKRKADQRKKQLRELSSIEKLTEKKLNQFEGGTYTPTDAARLS